MAETTGIEWADHTFNPWTGCTKVSPACDHCYAEAWARRSGQVEWGGPRRRTTETNWSQPFRWNRKALADGVRRRVFCASLADVFDNQVPEAWRQDLWGLIAACEGLDWLLLTKRPQNIARMLPAGWGDGWSHVWLGTTAENRREARRRVPCLLATPARLRFLSCEPLLELIDLRGLFVLNASGGAGIYDSLTGEWRPGGLTEDPSPDGPVIGWIIAGGESGPGARLMDPDWARGLRDQCAAAGVPFFMKQMARKEPIPADLLVREHPRMAEAMPSGGRQARARPLPSPRDAASGMGGIL